MNIKDALLRLVEEKFKVQGLRLCIVESVDDAEATCNVRTVEGDEELINVRLQTASDYGLYLKPLVDSYVIVGEVRQFDYVVVMYSGIESIQMLDGTYGGLVKVIELTEKLNNLENKVNDIITTFNTHVHSGVQTGGGSSAVTPTTIAGTLTPTTQSEIENDKITHGDSPV